MFNSTTAERWPFPRYFVYNIVRGPGNTRVEWIRVYIPGWDRLRMTRPLIVSGAGFTTLKFTGLATAWEAPLQTPSLSRSPMRPFIHGNIVIGIPENTTPGHGTACFPVGIA